MLRFTSNLIIQMTRKCNLNCKYCYEEHENPWGNKYISFEEFKKLVDTAIYYRCVLGRVENEINFHFHGGEVLTIPWDELRKCIEYVELRKQTFPGLTWCIQSNGLKINDDIAKFIASKDPSLGISFDGFEANDRLSKEGNIAFIEKLKRFHDLYGTRFASISVLTTDNIKTWYKDMKEVSSFFDSVGANVLNPRCGYEDRVPSEEDLWEYYYKPSLESFLTDNPLPERELIGIITQIIDGIVFGSPNTDKTGCFNKLCGHGANMTSVEPDLTLGCCDKFLSTGKYKDKLYSMNIDTLDFLGLQQINYTCHFYKEMFKLFDSMGCSNCRANRICGGDCQAFNISKYGEVRMDKARCSNIRKVYDFVADNWYKILQKTTVTVNSTNLSILPSALAVLEKNNLELKVDMINFRKSNVYVIKKECLK